MGTRHRVLVVSRLALGIRPQASGIRHWALGVRHWVQALGHLAWAQGWHIPGRRTLPDEGKLCSVHGGKDRLNSCSFLSSVPGEWRTLGKDYTYIRGRGGRPGRYQGHPSSQGLEGSMEEITSTLRGNGALSISLLREGGSSQ